MLWNQQFGVKVQTPRSMGNAFGDVLQLYLDAWSGAIVENYKWALKATKAQLRLVCLEHLENKAYIFRIVDQAENIYATAYLPKWKLSSTNRFAWHTVLKEVFTIECIEKTETGEQTFDIVFEKQSY